MRLLEARWLARLRKGARFALVFVAACAPIVYGTPARAAFEDGPGPLPWRVPGRIGFTVDAVASPDSTGQVLDVFVRVPPATLASMAIDSTRISRLRVTARLRGGFGGKPREEVREFAIDPADSTGFGKVLGLRFAVRPGVHRLAVRLEDVFSRKRGLIYTGRQVKEGGRIEGDLTVPAPQAERDLSDVEFVWAERSAGASSAFLRGGRSVVPNPERLYGLFASDVRAIFSARARPGDARPWRWIARVLDADGREVAVRETTAAAGRWLEDGVAFDVSRQPSGGYDLELKAWQEGDTGALLRRAHFSVAWQSDSWVRNPGDVSDEVHFLLEPANEDSFALLHPGEQEQALERFWRDRDPTQDTAENEMRETFYQRVAYANQTYKRVGAVKGMFSDMGRTYIRYGEPSEVEHQVIPTGDETLDRVLAELAATESRAIGDLPLKGPGGDLRPFELWIYEGDIAPPPDADPRTADRARRKRLVFLFVDEHGLGDYRLRYSTE